MKNLTRTITALSLAGILAGCSAPKTLPGDSASITRNNSDKVTVKTYLDFDRDGNIDALLKGELTPESMQYVTGAAMPSAAAPELYVTRAQKEKWRQAQNNGMVPAELRTLTLFYGKNAGRGITKTLNPPVLSPAEELRANTEYRGLRIIQ